MLYDYPDLEFDDMPLPPDQLDREAEQLLESATIRLPEYSVRTPDAELFRVSSALQRLGIVFLRPQGERKAGAIPQTVMEEANALQLRAQQQRAGLVIAEEDEDGETDLDVESLSETMQAMCDETRAQYQVIAAERRAGLAVRTMDRIVEMAGGA